MPGAGSCVAWAERRAGARLEARLGVGGLGSCKGVPGSRDACAGELQSCAIQRICSQDAEGGLARLPSRGVSWSWPERRRKEEER